jgi:hypothetical protein
MPIAAADCHRRNAPISKILPSGPIGQFGRDMRERLTDGSTAVRKAYLQSLIDPIEVDDNVIRIKGDKDLLEKAVLAGKARAIRIRG